MGVRTNLEIAFQIGRDNALDDTIIDDDQQQLLDTLDHGTTGTGLLTALQTNFVIPLGPVLEARIVYILVENGDVRVTFGGGLATHAQIDGTGAVYPTGFFGGETLTFTLDGTPVSISFDVLDQTLAQVINRINAACALLGFPTPIAQNTGSGQLRIKSATTGTSSVVQITGGSGRATLGLPLTTNTGSNATPGTSPMEIRRPADPNGATAAAGVLGVFAGTVKTTSITVDNLSDNDTLITWGIAGDITVSEC